MRQRSMADITFNWSEADVPGIGAPPRRSVVAEDIRDLQRWTGHGGSGYASCGASRAQKVEFRAMVGEAVDLAVVELDCADRLVRGDAGEALRAVPPIAAMAHVLLQPRRDRRRRDVAVRLLLETGSGFFQRKAGVVIG